LQTIVAISGVGLSTSGNYRQFYYMNGKKYAHTINPKTGYPVEHNLLSATVIAPTCMQADAYATAFMVLGVDSSLALCNRIPDMECYLISADEAGNYQVAYTDGFKKYFSE
jgi:thiamine biosynthesis lipoprotein